MVFSFTRFVSMSALFGVLFACLLFAFSCGDSKPTAPPQEQLPDSAVIEGENISLRTDPLPTAAEIESMGHGQKVKIIRRSNTKVKISGFDEYWYFVRLETGIEGWVYGAKLSIGKKKDQQEQEKLIKGLRQLVVGKWWEIKSGGSTGYRKIYFWSDGKYKHGYGSGYMDEGKYEVLTHEKVIFLDKGSGMGNKLYIRQIGRDIRLVAEYKGDTFVFRKGDGDPDSKEVGLQDDPNKKKK